MQTPQTTQRTARIRVTRNVRHKGGLVIERGTIFENARYSPANTHYEGEKADWAVPHPRFPPKPGLGNVYASIPATHAKEIV